LRLLSHGHQLLVFFLLEESRVISVEVLHDKLFGLDNFVVEHRVGQSRFVHQFSNLSFAVGADQLGTLLKGSDVGSELTDSLGLLTHGEGVLGKTVFVAAHVFGCHHHDSINKPEVLLERVNFKS
jgi:hypothetical protein